MKDGKSGDGMKKIKDVGFEKEHEKLKFSLSMEEILVKRNILMNTLKNQLSRVIQVRFFKIFISIEPE